MSHVRSSAAAIALVSVLAAMLFAGATPAAADGVPWPWKKAEPYPPGSTVTLTGRVTTPDGRPLAGMAVVLEMSREAFRLNELGRERGPALKVPVTTDAEGRYRLAWNWDGHYNVFELVVALELLEWRPEGVATVYEPFHRRDVAAEVRGRGPLEIDLVVEETARLKNLQAFFAGLSTDDLRHVYEEMGLPDRIDQGEEEYDPDWSFWYFAAGKVYRFEDGDLDGVVPFEPIAPELGGERENAGNDGGSPP